MTNMIIMNKKLVIIGLYIFQSVIVMKMMQRLITSNKNKHWRRTLTNLPAITYIYIYIYI